MMGIIVWHQCFTICICSVLSPTMHCIACTHCALLCLRPLWVALLAPTVRCIACAHCALHCLLPLCVALLAPTVHCLHPLCIALLAPTVRCIACYHCVLHCLLPVCVLCFSLKFVKIYAPPNYPFNELLGKKEKLADASFKGSDLPFSARSIWQLR